MNPTTDEVEPSHSASNALDFGDVGKSGNIHQECYPCIVEPFNRINGPSKATSLSIPPNTLTAPLSTSLQHSLGLCIVPSPNRPLTRSVANRRDIGHTLLMARVVPRNGNHAPTQVRPSFETMPDNMGTATRSFPSSSTVDECGLVSVISIATQTRTVARIEMPLNLPSTSAI